MNAAELSDHKQTVEAVENAPKQPPNARAKDRAAEFLSNATEYVIVSEANNKRILRRIDLTVFPIMLRVYFLQQLDGWTCSHTSVFGFVEDANLKYSWLGPIVYIPQLVMQPLIVYVLVK